MNIVCRKHWAAYIPTGIVAACIVAVGIAAGSHAGNPATVLGCIVFAALLLGGDVFLTSRASLSLSGGVVTGRTGFIRSARLSAPVSRVQDVEIKNGLLGKIFGFHTITVTTAGTGGKEFVFAGFTNGPQLQQAILASAPRAV